MLKARETHRIGCCLVALAAVVAALLCGATAHADVGFLDWGSVVAWGSDGAGQVSGRPRYGYYTQVAAGQNFALALAPDGSIVAWGQDHIGQVSNRPTGTGYTQVAAGSDHGLALAADGRIVAWGSNSEGQVSGAPAGTGYMLVAGGHQHSLALTANGSIVGWGDDREGQVGGAPAGTGYKQVVGASAHSLALAADGSIVAWGFDGYGQVSDRPTGTGYIQVAGAGCHNLALAADGRIVAWGENVSGLVSGAPTGVGYAQVAAGGNFGLALTADGSIAAWGADGSGQVSGAPTEGHYFGLAAGSALGLALKARVQYDDLLVTGTGLQAMLQRDVSVGGNATIDTAMTVQNNPTMTVAGTTTLAPGASLPGSGWTLRTHGLTIADGVSYEYRPEVAQVSGTITVEAGGTLTSTRLGFTAFSCDSLVLNGGSVVAPNGVALGVGKNLLGHGTVEGRIAAGFGSTIHAAGTLALGDANAFDGFFSDGVLYTNEHEVTIHDRNVAVLGSLTVLGDGAAGGVLTAGNARPSDNYAHFLVEQGKNIVGRGTVNGHVKNHGDAVGDGTGAGERLVFNSPWTVSGKGTFTNTLILGTFAPGDSPTITTGTNQGFGGKVEIELGGLTPGSGNDNHDQINDTATIWLFTEPELAILPWNNFVPAIGDEFVVMTWAEGLSGTFGTVTVDPWFTSHGIDFNVSYVNPTGAGSLVLSAVPEPGSIALLLVVLVGGLLAWACRRRR